MLHKFFQRKKTDEKKSQNDLEEEKRLEEEKQKRAEFEKLLERAKRTCLPLSPSDYFLSKINLPNKIGEYEPIQITGAIGESYNLNDAADRALVDLYQRAQKYGVEVVVGVRYSTVGLGIGSIMNPDRFGVLAFGTGLKPKEE